MKGFGRGEKGDIMRGTENYDCAIQDGRRDD